MSGPSVSRWIRWDELPPPMIRGTYSTIREDVSRPYHLILDPAMRRIKYLVFRMASSKVVNLVFVETDLWIKQNLNVPISDGP